MRDEPITWLDDPESLRQEIERLRAKLNHAYDIGHFSTCKKCGMPMRPGCICEVCGWDRSEVSDDS